MRHIVEVGCDKPATLREKLGCLAVKSGDQPEVRLPLPEVAVVILGPMSMLSGSVLGALSAFGAVVLTLDRRFAPASLTLPVVGHVLHAERLRLQIDKTPAVGPAAWAQIVRAKINGQAVLLASDMRQRLCALARAVEPADPKNIEAQAARVYWPSLLGASFRRAGDGGPNRLLNYGYAVLRGLVARAVCAAGFHPAIGLHHAGRDAFALADDLMEPARPIVDRAVRLLVDQRGADVELDGQSKRALLGALLSPVQAGREQLSLFEAFGRTCGSLYEMLRVGGGELWICSCS